MKNFSENERSQYLKYLSNQEMTILDKHRDNVEILRFVESNFLGTRRVYALNLLSPYVIFTYRKKILNAKFLHHDKLFYAVVAGYLKYDQDIKSVLQTVKFNVCKKFLSTDKTSHEEFEETDFERYVNTSLKYECYRFLKSRKTVEIEDIDPTYVCQVQVVDKLLDYCTLTDLIKKIIGETDFRILELSAIHEYTYAQIAKELGFTNPSIVGVRLHRAKLKLQKLPILIEQRF